MMGGYGGGSLMRGVWPLVVSLEEYCLGSSSEPSGGRTVRHHTMAEVPTHQQQCQRVCVGHTPSPYKGGLSQGAIVE